jgi:putative Mg2+ transporter-C (MgtC) family protein
VIGLTTASTIWLAAALGMGIGAGELALSAVAAVVVLLVLLVFPNIETWIDRVWEVRTYRIVCQAESSLQAEVEQMIQSAGLRIHQRHRGRSGSDLLYTFYLSGPPQAHHRLTEQLLMHPEVKNLEA